MTLLDVPSSTANVADRNLSPYILYNSFFDLIFIEETFCISIILERLILTVCNCFYVIFFMFSFTSSSNKKKRNRKNNNNQRISIYYPLRLFLLFENQLSSCFSRVKRFDTKTQNCKKQKQ